MKALIIEDSPSIVETISLALEIPWPGVKIVATTSGAEGIEKVGRESPDVIILDLGLPDISGYDVLRRIRQSSDTPVLILTARADEADIVKGLEWGADDYMTKPFRQLELIARLRGIMRRHAPRADRPLEYGPLKYDPSLMRVMTGAKEISLSRTEGLILACLLKNAGKVTPYAEIAAAMWGNDFPEANESIRVHIRHLREKLEEDPGKPRLILNKPGVGYLLSNPA